MNDDDGIMCLGRESARVPTIGEKNVSSVHFTSSLYIVISIFFVTKQHSAFIVQSGITDHSYGYVQFCLFYI